MTTPRDDRMKKWKVAGSQQLCTLPFLTWVAHRQNSFNWERNKLLCIKWGKEWGGYYPNEMTLKTKNLSQERMKHAKLHSSPFFPNKFNSVPAPKKGLNLNFKNKNKIKIAQKPSH